MEIYYSQYKITKYLFYSAGTTVATEILIAV